MFHRGVAQPGSAPALGAGSPQFKSGRPDQPSLQNGFDISLPDLFKGFRSYKRRWVLPIDLMREASTPASLANFGQFETTSTISSMILYFFTCYYLTIAL